MKILEKAENLFRRYSLSMIRKYKFLMHLYLFLLNINNTLKRDYKEKIFVIGFNKTGTTTLKKVLEDFGYKIGNQADAELISVYVLNERYGYLNSYLRSAEVFQDMPFSLRGLYKYLYEIYPNALFILSIRNDFEQWYSSLNRFAHKRLKNNSTDKKYLTVGDVKNLHYRYKTYDYEMSKKIWNSGKAYSDNSDELYDIDTCKLMYKKHIEEVVKFFEGTNNLIVVNCGEDRDYLRLCNFLDKKPLYGTFPHENKT